MADEILHIADNRNPEKYKNIATVDERRQQIEARKWLLSKALPKIYGDRLQVDHQIKKIEGVKVRFISEDEDVIEGEAKDITDGA